MAEEIQSAPEIIKALDIPKPSIPESSQAPIFLNASSRPDENLQPVPVIEEQASEVKLSGKKKRLIMMVKGAAGIKSKPNPFLPENSLSAIERYFHHMPDESAQV